MIDLNNYFVVILNFKHLKKLIMSLKTLNYIIPCVLARLILVTIFAFVISTATAVPIILNYSNPYFKTFILNFHI